MQQDDCLVGFITGFPVPNFGVVRKGCSVECLNARVCHLKYSLIDIKVCLDDKSIFHQRAY